MFGSRFYFVNRGWVLCNYFFGDLGCLYFILYFLGPNPSWVHQPGIIYIYVLCYIFLVFCHYKFEVKALHDVAFVR